MAAFSINGMDELSISLSRLATLTEEDCKALLLPAADYMQEQFKQRTEATFTRRTGDLTDSFAQTWYDGNTRVLIAPQGKHQKAYTGKRLKRDGVRRGKRGNYSGTNAEIAYILERGSPRIDATYFMQYASESAEPGIRKKMQEAWDDLQKKKGL